MTSPYPERQKFGVVEKAKSWRKGRRKKNENHEKLIDNQNEKNADVVAKLWKKRPNTRLPQSRAGGQEQ